MLGVLNLEFVDDIDSMLNALAALAEHGRGRLGVLVDGESGGDLLRAVLATPVELELVAMTAGDPERVGPLLRSVHERGCRAGLVVTSWEEARAGREAGQIS